MNITQIAANVQQVVAEFRQATFIYDLLSAYGTPKATIARLQKGGLNLSKVEDEIAWKNKLFFKESTTIEDLKLLFENILADEKALKHQPRFVVLTNYQTLLALDTKTKDQLNIALGDIVKHFDFFLPLAGMEKVQYQNENPADVKAAERMGKLYDEIVKDNPTWASSVTEVHSLNVFLSRVLFCFYAEDTGIFAENQFTNAIASHTQADGSDVASYLEQLFSALNAPIKQAYPDYLKQFPYVNGGLFKVPHSIPQFTSKSRRLIIECGQAGWADINPDIFGSMIQAVVTPEHRGGLGMHYTSVPNIMKVIEPLFLTELYDEFNTAVAVNSESRLKKLLDRLSRIKLFDPACGSGNFLIIAYKELRLLEIKILQELGKLQSNNPDFAEHQLSLLPKPQLRLGDAEPAASLNFESSIKLSQFYGIELDDFAHEVAALSLWLAEHQMNLKFKAAFGHSAPNLPLKEGGNIAHGNATRLNWELVCPKNPGDEIYILGNPPYLGSKNLNEIQRGDMASVFGKDGKTLDYIGAWFLKASKYSHGVNSKYAFVTTNSICQGEQVSILWKKVLGETQELFFAHQSFKWSNNAKDKAAVTVVIVGVRNKENTKKLLFNNLHQQLVENINPYLVSAKTVFIESKNNSISRLPEMIGGNVAYDSGHLIFEEAEMKAFLIDEPNTEKYFKKIMGGKELLNGGIRYCLWLKDFQLDEVKSIKSIEKKIEKVRLARLSAKDEGTHKLAERPHQFRDLNNPKFYLAIPKTSSERRNYIPLTFLNESYIPADSIRIIPDADPWLLSLLSSKIHMAWVKSVSGRLKTDYRYSKNISYNTFPFPPISEVQKAELEKCVRSILYEREQHSELTLAQLYDPVKMPDGLRQAHHQNDLAIERCYRPKPFDSDEERLEYLFKLYEQMIAEEKERGTLFEKEKKKTRK